MPRGRPVFALTPEGVQRMTRCPVLHSLKRCATFRNLARRLRRLLPPDEIRRRLEYYLTYTIWVHRI